MKNVIKSAAFLVAASTSTAAFAEGINTGAYLVPNIGLHNFDSSRAGDFDDSESLGLGLGYQFDSPWSLELQYHQGETELNSGTEFDHRIWSLDALYTFNQQGKWQPYLLTGLGDQAFELANGNSNEARETLLAAGAGIAYRFNNNVSLRADIRNNYSFDEEDNDQAAYLGLRFDFGSAEQLKQAVAEPETVAPEVMTPVLAAVLDVDKDGVEDGVDQCKATPADVKVDANGCALDSDNDGIADYMDKCNATPANAKVDAMGCPQMLTERKDFTLNVKFGNNSDAIQAGSFSDIDKLAVFLESYVNAKVTIEGHSDSRGAAAYNQKLSERRAKAVANYLVEKKGIAADRVKSVGYGESQPIADNNTAAGRQANRRVVAVVAAQTQRMLTK